MRSDGAIREGRGPPPLSIRYLNPRGGDLAAGKAREHLQAAACRVPSMTSCCSVGPDGAENFDQAFGLADEIHRLVRNRTETILGSSVTGHGYLIASGCVQSAASESVTFRDFELLDARANGIRRDDQQAWTVTS